MSDIEKQGIHASGGSTVVHRSHHDVAGDTELSTEVLLALDSAGFDLEASDTVAFDHIDLEALDRLVASTSNAETTSRIEFSIDQYGVVVTSDGDVTIRKQLYPTS